MKIWKEYLGLIMAMLLLIGCYDSKVDRLRIELLKQQILKLEFWEKQLNREIAVLQELVEALVGKKTILSVTQSPEGYAFLLSDESVLEVFHGKNGAPGEDGVIAVPKMSVRDSSDGHLYWTINGEVWKNEVGRGMQADGVKGPAGDVGKPGEQGEAGIVPRVRINPQTDFWEISADGGNTWDSTGVKATGEQGEQGEQGLQGGKGTFGDQIFKNDGIWIQDKYVEFNLTDGGSFRLPRRSTLSLQFPFGQSVVVPLNMEEIVPFVILGTGGIPKVEAVGDNGWKAIVKMDKIRIDSGVIMVTAPEIERMGTVFVLLTTEFGDCWTWQIEAKTLPKSSMLQTP